MSETTRNTEIKKEEFDYFYALIKNWRTILLISSCFLLVGLVSLFVTSKTHSSKSTFSISLNSQINTAYGSYNLKTLNPMHYLSFVELNQFENNVLAKVDQEGLTDVQFKIEEEKPVTSSNNLTPVYPNKFELIVSGNNEKYLNVINDFAIDELLSFTDKKIQTDMLNHFSSTLTFDIENLNFSIQIKEELINSLKDELNRNTENRNSVVSKNNVIDSRLLNSLAGDEQSLVVSILLNEEKGSEHFQMAILAIEEIQLRKMKNELNRKSLLLKKLVDAERSDNLNDLFPQPFGDSFMSLTPSEVQFLDGRSFFIKRVAIFLFLGLFISFSVVLLRSYYSLMYKDKL